MNQFSNLPIRMPVLGVSNISANGTTAVSGVYAFGSTGNVVAVRFVAKRSTTLASALFFASAIAGTGGTVTAELRNYSSSTVPGATLHATGSVVTDTASKWYKVTFGTPFSVVDGTTYFLLFTSNDATNYVTISRASGIISYDTLGRLFNSVTSTNGFSTGSDAGLVAPFVLVFGDGSRMGVPYTSQAASANNALERGHKILGLDCSLAIGGASWVGGFSNISQLRVYADGVAPGGTTLFTRSIDAAALALGIVQFPEFVLAANTVYRVVLGYSGNSTGFGYGLINDNTTYAADLEACSFASQGLAHTIDNGAGGWTDSTDRVSRFTLAVTRLVASEGQQQQGITGGLY